LAIYRNHLLKANPKDRSGFGLLSATINTNHQRKKFRAKEKSLAFIQYNRL